MNAQMRMQFTLPFVEFDTHDSVFGITPTDGTCKHCGHALVCVEDTLDLDRFACVSTGMNYECTNEECTQPEKGKTPCL
jgi:hypothetical protein